MSLKYFDYQIEAREFVKKVKRGYVALDLGMGKTITSLAVAENLSNNHVLLVAEKNEIATNENFRKEVTTHFSDVFDYVNLRETKLEDIPSDKKVVCGINPESMKVSGKEAKMFDTAIVDEATIIKNTETKRFKKLHEAMESIENLVLLSGTPMMNGAAELYAPLVLMDHPMVAGKGKEGKKAYDMIFCGGQFRQMRKLPKGVLPEKARYIAPYKFTHFQWWNKGTNNLRVLRYLVRDHFFIKSKEETKIFKKKTRRVEYVNMSMEWLAEYMQAWEDYKREAGKRLTEKQMKNVKELRNLIENGQCYQVNSRWKAKRVAKDIADGKYGDRRIVVFSLYVETDEILQAELKRLGVSYRPFDELQEWKAGDEQVLAGRIRSHAKGGNAPEASVFISIDMDFVPANNIQAENRIDRPEQKNEMEIVYYLTEGDDVVDAHVRKINREKMRRIREFMRPLTEDEIIKMPQMLQALRVKYPKETHLLGI